MSPSTVLFIVQMLVTKPQANVYEYKIKLIPAGETIEQTIAREECEATYANCPTGEELLK